MEAGRLVAARLRWRSRSARDEALRSGLSTVQYRFARLVSNRPTNNRMPCLGKPQNRGRKPWTKLHQQPWNDAFEGVEGGGRRVLALCFASGRKTLATSKQGQSAARKPLSRPAQCWRAYRTVATPARAAKGRAHRAAWGAAHLSGPGCFAFAVPRRAADRRRVSEPSPDARRRTKQRAAPLLKKYKARDAAATQAR